MPARKSPAAETSTDIIRLLGVTKYSSLPSRPHATDVPPSTDTCDRAPVGGNGCTYICEAPLSFEKYAIHFPSGEKRPPLSPKGDCRKGFGVRSPLSGISHMSMPVLGSSLRNRRNRPSGETSRGYSSRSDFRSSSSAPTPDAAFW